MRKKLRKLVLKLTHRMWNREIARLLLFSYARGTISSCQMHSLAALFDPTQKHRVY